MPKLVWNGGLEIDWKTIGAVLGFVFIAGGNWIHYKDLKAAFDKHVEISQTRDQTVTAQGYRLGSMEVRVDRCCPLYEPDPGAHEFTPRDLAPPAMGPRGGGSQ